MRALAIQAGPGRCSCSSWPRPASPWRLDRLGRPGDDRPVRRAGHGHAARRGHASPIWGFGMPTTPGDCTHRDGRACPGRSSSVNEGDVGHDQRHQRAARRRTPLISFEIPGVDVRRRARPTPRSGATVDRDVHRRARPGTYLYQSGGDAGRQEAMGLVRRADRALDAPPNQAYDTAAHRVRRRGRRWCSSAVDPAFNAAPGHVRHARLPGDLLADQRQGLPGHARRSPRPAGPAGAAALPQRRLRQHHDAAARHAPAGASPATPGC